MKILLILLLSCIPVLTMAIKRLILALLLLSCVQAALAQTSVFNCTSFVTTTPTGGQCKVTISGATGAANFSIPNSGGPSSLFPSATAGPSVNLQPTGIVHNSSSLIWQQKVNTQAFTTSFTFVPDGWSLSFFLEDVTNIGFSGAQFIGGGGCEAGIYQGNNGIAAIPLHIFALDFDQYNNVNNGTSFGYSNVQIYQTGQNPCLPNLSDNVGYYPTLKVSTSPVPMNSPATTVSTTTGDTYSATITYTGGDLTLDFFDVTAGGSCPGASCFTQTWSGVNIPSIVGSNTAWVGFGATTNGGAVTNLLINSFSYSTTTPPSTPVVSTYTTGGSGGGNSTIAGSISTTAGGTLDVTAILTGGMYKNQWITDSGSGVAANTYTTSGPTGSESNFGNTGNYTVNNSQTVTSRTLNANLTTRDPTFSPAAGSYSGTQSVTVSSPTPNAYYCYTLSATTPSLFPQTDNIGGCTVGTLYTGAIIVSSTQTLYAMAGVNYTASGAGGGLPSDLIVGTYTISGGSATAPSCTPTSGSSSSPITVTCSNSNSGTTIMCYTENGTTPATNGSGTGCTTGTSLSGSSNTITISSTVTSLKVIAGTSVLPDSTVSSYGAYTITTSAPTNLNGVVLSGLTAQ